MASGRPQSRIRAATAFAVLVALVGCAPAASPDPRNVVLIVVDTLRADHLGAYGYARATSPRIDSFAGDSLLFTQARAQAPCTYPSVNSLLTSQPPERLLRPYGFAIPRRVPTLAQMLRGHGWQTAAVSASPIVRRSPSAFNPTGGFQRGFESFDEDCLMASAACVNRVAVPLLSSLEEPFLLYLHYMDPHSPFAPPPEHERRFAGRFDGPEFIAAGDPGPITRHRYGNGAAVELDAVALGHLVDLYDEEIRYVDAEFGKLIDALDALDRSDRTIVAVTSDHGEEFLEHGDALHCRNLHDTQIRIPLILRVPGEPGRRIPANAQNLDVVPTLLDYLGLDAAPAKLHGRSLRPARDGSAPGAAPVFAWWKGSRSVVAGGLKLIVERDSHAARLFDLEADPEERQDLSEQRPEDVERMRGLLAKRASAVGEPAVAVPDAQVEEQLRTLGYLD